MWLYYHEQWGKYQEGSKQNSFEVKSRGGEFFYLLDLLLLTAQGKSFFPGFIMLDSEVKVDN